MDSVAAHVGRLRGRHHWRTDERPIWQTVDPHPHFRAFPRRMRLAHSVCVYSETNELFLD